ncbi:hypothetical protein Sango_1201500 [Sesamum angolense]|uniref:Uncharacterized protein n=1 Tax=Sesamum angolense TaxID=2727404 RepID=A0AAE2BX33_9LAMI|nr:hypothetical protein Sango_1201500 [Sesamum angolense]
MAAKPLTSEAIALAEKKMDMTLDDIIKTSKTNAMKPKRQRISRGGQKFVNNVPKDNSFKVRRYMDTRSSLRQVGLGAVGVSVFYVVYGMIKVLFSSEQGTLARRRSNFKANQFPLGTEAARKAAFAPIRGGAFKQSRPFSVNKPRYCQSVTGILCLTELFGIELVRAGAPTIQKNPVNGGGFTVKARNCFTFPDIEVSALRTISYEMVPVVKKSNHSNKPNIGPRQNHQTLDSLFANMKEERKRVLSQQNNWSRRNGGDQPRVTWARGHMRN